MKVLITSDNHLGFKENDEVRSNDSFNTFEEILLLAKNLKVDLILQGGDLFHENRPSRYCIDRIIQLLSTYCLGNESVKFKSNIDLNCFNKDINISMPIIAIHGNHDDPSGFNNISPLNILHSANLITYIGRINNFEKIEIMPVIIEKGVKLAIYSLGHIKDRKLYKAFVEGRVSFKKLNNYKEYYNILMVHQNRVPRDKDYLPDSFIDDFFDLVIYGHEHESIILKNRFVVLQPGSTIRTSLCEGEMFEKCVYLLTINEEACINKIRLKTVRSLIMDTMKIMTGDMEKEIYDKINKLIETTKSKIDQGINKCNIVYKKNSSNLSSETEECEEEISNKRTKVISESFLSINLISNESNNDNRDFSDIKHEESNFITRIIESDFGDGTKNINETKCITNFNLNCFPLLRLRVESDSQNSINIHKFGLSFKNKVANPFDMLKFIRRRQVKNINIKKKINSSNISEVLIGLIGEKHLEAIPEFRFIESVEDFVNKDDKEAFDRMIKENVKDMVEKINIKDTLINNLDKEIRKIKDRKNLTNEYIKKKDYCEDNKNLRGENNKFLSHSFKQKEKFDEESSIFITNKNSRILRKQVNSADPSHSQKDFKLLQVAKNKLEFVENLAYETYAYNTLSSPVENFSDLEKPSVLFKNSKNEKTMSCKNDTLEQKKNSEPVKKNIENFSHSVEKKEVNDSGSDISITDLLFEF